MGYAKFGATAAGNNVIIAGVDGQKIQVTGIFFTCGTTSQVILRGGTTSAGDFTGSMQFQAGYGLNLPSNGSVLFDCNLGDSFSVNLAGLLPNCARAILYEIVFP